MKPTTTWTDRDGVVVTIRPIRATDLALEQRFVAGLSAATGYQRLMSGRRLSLEELQRFTDIDPECEAALIALTVEHGREREVGVARYVKESCGDAAEFAIVLSDDWQGRGLGAQLLERLLDLARQRGVKHVFGTTLSDNHAMVALARRLGFRASRNPASAAVTNLKLELAGAD